MDDEKNMEQQADETVRLTLIMTKELAVALHLLSERARRTPIKEIEWLIILACVDAGILKEEEGYVT